MPAIINASLEAGAHLNERRHCAGIDDLRLLAGIAGFPACNADWKSAIPYAGKMPALPCRIRE